MVRGRGATVRWHISQLAHLLLLRAIGRLLPLLLLPLVGAGSQEPRCAAECRDVKLESCRLQRFALFALILQAVLSRG